MRNNSGKEKSKHIIAIMTYAKILNMIVSLLKKSLNSILLLQFISLLIKVRKIHDDTMENTISPTTPSMYAPIAAETINNTINTYSNTSPIRPIRYHVFYVSLPFVLFFFLVLSNHYYQIDGRHLEF